MLVRVFRCWDKPDILRQTPGHSGKWGDVQFICEEDGECDFVMVLNRVGKEDRHAICPENNVWAVFQDPFVFRIHDWMIDNHQQFKKVFTHHIFNNDKKYVAHYPMLAWYIDKSYDELKALGVPEKTKNISWITSNKSLYPGHRERMGFIEFIQQSGLDIDIYGKGIRPIDDKWDGQAPYKYSLVVENSSSPDYWTEKLADSYLAYCLPIYYGCTNIDDYFPSDAYIRIDIHKPEEALRIIQNAINNNEWEKRLDAIKKSRELVLDTYNFFPYIANLMKQAFDPSEPRKSITLVPYKRTLKRRVLNAIEKIKRLFGAGNNY
jgi:hypothetical protein